MALSRANMAMSVGKHDGHAIRRLYRLYRKYLFVGLGIVYIFITTIVWKASVQ